MLCMKVWRSGSETEPAFCPSPFKKSIIGVHCVTFFSIHHEIWLLLFSPSHIISTSRRCFVDFRSFDDIYTRYKALAMSLWGGFESLGALSNILLENAFMVAFYIGESFVPLIETSLRGRNHVALLGTIIPFYFLVRGRVSTIPEGIILIVLQKNRLRRLSFGNNHLNQVCTTRVQIRPTWGIQVSSIYTHTVAEFSNPRFVEWTALSLKAKESEKGHRAHSVRVIGHALGYLFTARAKALSVPKGRCPTLGNSEFLRYR